MTSSAIVVCLMFAVFAMWMWSKADRTWREGESTWFARELARLLFVVLFALCWVAVMRLEDVLLTLGIDVLKFGGVAGLVAGILLVSLAFVLSEVAQDAVLRWQRRTHKAKKGK